MNPIYSEYASELRDRLCSPKEIAIIMHRNPDGDAIGASLGLAAFLKDLGHFVTVISPSEYPAGFKWMKGVEGIVVYDLQPDLVGEKLKNADLVFSLDFNGLDRIDKVGKMLHDLNVEKWMIDHHVDPEPFADFPISNTGASSTCEMIYETLLAAGYRERITEWIATCLYTGILTDTGSFKHSTSARLFEIAADLKRIGVDDAMIQDKVFNSLTEKQLRLLGHCLVNRMEIMDNCATGLIHLTKEDYKAFQIHRGDTEGIVNYMLMMPHIRIAAFITEQPTLVKVSFRSKGDISVQTLARDHFNGGGHFNASGGYSFQPLDKVIRRFKSIVNRKYGNENEN